MTSSASFFPSSPLLPLPLSSFLQLLSSDHPSPPPPSFLQLYCRSRAARKHNYAGFLFPRLFFYVQPRMSVYLLLPLLTIVATFYDPVDFSLSRCVKLLGNANEFVRLFYHSYTLVSLLRICQITHSKYVTARTIRTSMRLNNNRIRCFLTTLL